MSDPAAENFEATLAALLASADLPERLTAALAGPLPGWRAHRRWAPELAYGRHAGPPPENTRHAATMLLLARHDGAWRLPLTVRHPQLSTHAGQVCLPGGSLERDESPEQAALREMEEEMGVPSSGVRLLGRLTPLWIFVSNFWVTPLVAACEQLPPLVPQLEEVDALIELPLAALLDPTQHGRQTIERRGLRFSAPYFACQGQRVWGATALMLGELAAVLARMAEER